MVMVLMLLRIAFIALVLCSQSVFIATSFTVRVVKTDLPGSVAPMALLYRHKNHRIHRFYQKSSLGSVANSRAAVDTIGTVAILVPSLSDELSPFGSKSPVPRPSYQLAAEQLARKIRQFSDGKISTHIAFPLERDDDENDACISSNALIALGLKSPSDIHYLSRTFRKRRHKQQELQAISSCQFAVDCGSNNYAPIVGPYDEANPSIASSIAPWSEIASGKRLAAQMTELFEKYTSDEFALAIMLFFNQFSGTKIPWVQHSIDVTWEKGLFQNAKEIYAMISKCGPCIAKCLNDENCSSCIKGRATLIYYCNNFYSASISPNTSSKHWIKLTQEIKSQAIEQLCHTRANY
jgi:hypothetical protein